MIVTCVSPCQIKGCRRTATRMYATTDREFVAVCDKHAQRTEGGDERRD